jgi:hypothetical protein
MGMGEKRLTNSELRLGKLEEEEAKREGARGIVELFDEGERKEDEDPRLEREPGK